MNANFIIIAEWGPGSGKTGIWRGSGNIWRRMSSPHWFQIKSENL